MRGVKAAVFVDRDGVLNQAVVRDGVPIPPKRPSELVILPGVPEACDALRDAGFALIVITNQPDIARGLQRLAVVDAIHVALRLQVRVDAVYFCPHDDRDQCACRKPAPGMLLTAAQEHDLDLSRSFMVGDRWRDIEAGRRANCQTVLIENGYRERAAEDPDVVVASLIEAAAWIQGVAGLRKVTDVG